MIIRQLGYPTKNSLKNWHREYEQCLDLSAGYLVHRRTSRMQKQLVVKHYLEHGRCLAAAVNALRYQSRKLLLHPETHMHVVGRSLELSPAMKQTVAIELCMRNGRAQSVAQELGVSWLLLCSWKNQVLGHHTSAFMKRKQHPAPNSERAELEKQAKALRQHIRRLRLERGLLKKANATPKKTWASTSGS